MSDNKANNDRRFSGILTENDREFLEALEWGEQSSKDRDTRHRIRQRVIQGIADLHFLAHYLHDKDRKLIFRELTSSPDLTIGSVAFLYLGARDTVEDFDEERDAMGSFAELIQQGIEVGDQRRGLFSEPEVSIDHQAKEPDPDKIRNQLLDGEGTIAQLNYLIREEEDDPLLESIINRGKVMTIEDANELVEVTPKMAENILSRNNNE